MITDCGAIWQGKRSNGVSAVSFSGSPMKKLGVAITKLKEPDCTPLFPILFFVFKQQKDVSLKDPPKIGLRNRQSTPIFQSINVHKSLIRIINQDRESGKPLAPVFKGISKVLV